MLTPWHIWAGVFCLLLFAVARPVLAAYPSAAPATVAVQLNWRHQFEFAAFYAAIEKGFYREAGLEVRLLEGGPGINVIDTVVHGQAQFGVANSSLILAHAQGRPVVALAALMQHSAFALLARRDRGIENVSDLAGKVVSCAPHACDEIRAYLTTSGLGDGRVRYVPLKSAMVEQNFDHSDATDIFLSNQGFQIIGQEDRYVLLTPRSAGIDLYGDILFSVRDRISGDPEQVAGFREATIKGLHYAMSHPDELIDLIMARYNTQGKSREHLAYEAAKLAELTRLDLVEPGYMSLGRWRHVRDVYAGLGMLPADYPVESMIYRPENEPWPDWVVWVLVALVVAVIASSLVAAHLRRINVRLYREIAQRAKAEVALVAGQEQFRRFVDQANSLVAHELRTPLSVLQAHVGVIELKLGRENDCGKNLGAMKAAISRLQVLFEKNLAQVFASTQFESGDKQVVINESMRRIIADQQTLMPSSAICYTGPESSPEVSISRDMFDTMMINLLENALKYSAPNAEVDVSTAEDGGFVVIAVSNIPSIPTPDDVEILFAKHARGDTDDSIVGTGVGLHLVRLIAEMHGGSARIDIDTSRTDGVRRFTVRIRLPLAAVPAAPFVDRRT